MLNSIINYRNIDKEYVEVRLFDAENIKVYAVSIVLYIKMDLIL